MATKEEKIEKLKRLNSREMQAVFWFCRDQTDDEIMTSLGIDDPKTLGNIRTSLNYQLELDSVSNKGKRDEIYLEYCPVLRELVAGEDALKRWMRPRVSRRPKVKKQTATETQEETQLEEGAEAEESVPVQKQSNLRESASLSEGESEKTPVPDPQNELNRRADEKVTEENQSKIAEEKKGGLADSDNTPKLDPQDELNRRHNERQQREEAIFRILRWVIPGFFVLIALWLAGTLANNVIGNLPTLTPSHTPTVPSKTATNTMTATITFTPSTTPPPSRTPPPTNTPQPTRTPAPTPFSAGFENGLPDWIVLKDGDLSFPEGRLLALVNSKLEIGSDDWQNYQIEYEAQHGKGCMAAGDDGVSAHAVDEDHLLLFTWNYCVARWDEISGVNRYPVSDNIPGFSGGSGSPVRIRMVAEDGNFKIYINGDFYSELFDDKYLKGKAYIYVAEAVSLDNIVIRPIP